MDKAVVIDRLNVKELSKQIGWAAELIGLGEASSKAKAIFIKPNLTYPSFKKGVTTSIAFVQALVSALLNFNSGLRIYIGEGDGGYNSFSMTQAMWDMGFFEMEKTYHNVHILNISEIPSTRIDLNLGKTSYSIELPKIFFEAIDFSITCPVPKVHCMTKISLSLKNQWGCLPDIMRLKNHYVFDDIIGQVCQKLKFRYAFLDGKYGLDNNGPMVGDPVELNWFVASNSLGAFDRIVSQMMGFDWTSIGHLRKAGEYGLIPDEKEIDVIGDLDSLKRKFVLKRNFWNYPALAAFHSKTLTHLFYFSRWAKLLHNIMYTFRKRPINT